MKRERGLGEDLASAWCRCEFRYSHARCQDFPTPSVKISLQTFDTIYGKITQCTCVRRHFLLEILWGGQVSRQFKSFCQSLRSGMSEYEVRSFCVLDLTSRAWTPGRIGVLFVRQHWLFRGLFTVLCYTVQSYGYGLCLVTGGLRLTLQ